MSASRKPALKIVSLTLTDGFLGMTSMKYTPPSSHLYLTFWSDTCCVARPSVNEPVSKTATRPTAKTYLGNSGLRTLLFLLVPFDSLCGSRLEGDERKREFTTVFIFYADNAGIQDIWMTEEMALNSKRGSETLRSEIGV